MSQKYVTGIRKYLLSRFGWCYQRVTAKAELNGLPLSRNL